MLVLVYLNFDILNLLNILKQVRLLTSYKTYPNKKTAYYFVGLLGKIILVNIKFEQYCQSEVATKEKT